VHALSQHTPSTQIPDWQESGALQFAPSCSKSSQTPAAQYLPLWQSVVLAQSPLHLSVPQTYGAQIFFCARGHEPVPEQNASNVAAPLEQLGARHCVAESGYTHAVVKVPSHCPPHAVPSDPQIGRGACGGPLTGEQVPIFPDTLHASHCPLHAPSQQTPSTQNPLVHMFADVQPEGGASFGRQIPAPTVTRSQ
jgi:hypothetical protein